MSQTQQQTQQQQQPKAPTPEQVFQEYHRNNDAINQNELNKNKMFDMVYNALLQSQAQIEQLSAEKAQLIEQLNQFTKQKDTTTKGKK